MEAQLDEVSGFHGEKPARSGSSHLSAGLKPGGVCMRSGNRSDAWKNAKNLLCVRLDSLGDVLMTGPAIRALKESSPGRRITLLTSAGGEAAGRLLPEVDE